MKLRREGNVSLVIRAFGGIRRARTCATDEGACVPALRHDASIAGCP
ncbi:MAG: hypothetical protein ABI585_15645 [Betaproteobacteria bacterium]